MARLSKCKTCSKELRPDEKHVYSNKNYCKQCYDSKIKDKQEYDSLISWICEYFNTKVPNGLILKQVKEYKEAFNYTYGGMNYCLWYITYIKNVKLEIKYGIALVKFEYENAKEYFLQQENIKKSMVKPKNLEVVKTIKLKNNTGLYGKFLINIDELISEGGKE